MAVAAMSTAVARWAVRLGCSPARQEAPCSRSAVPRHPIPVFRMSAHQRPLVRSGLPVLQVGRGLRCDRRGGRRRYRRPARREVPRRLQAPEVPLKVVRRLASSVPLSELPLALIPRLLLQAPRSTQEQRRLLLRAGQCPPAVRLRAPLRQGPRRCSRPA
jgi:hypothetical protein